MFEPNRALAPFNEPTVILHLNHWPQTWGWYCLLAAGMMWGVVKIRIQLKRWWQDRYRREALRRLYSIAELPFGNRFAAAHELLKIVSIYVFGREVIATLVDKDWLELLNASVDTILFSNEMQSSLHKALYSGRELNETELQCYLQAIESWLKLHRLERMDA